MQRSNDDFSITTGRDGSRTFGDHDDRWVPRGRGSQNRRRYNSNFHNRGSGRGRGRGRGSYSWSAKYHGSDQRCLDQEGDVLMGGDADQGASRRYNPYGARPPSRRGKRGNRYTYHKNDRPSQQQGGDGSAARRLGLPVRHSGKTWFKVSIPQAKKVEKDVILGLLGSHIPGTFRPIQFHYEGEMGVFFVDDRDIADILKGLSKTITIPNTNFKLVTNVRPSSPPMTTVTDDTKKRLMEVMSAQYDPSIKVLDLTALQDHKGLLDAGFFLPFNRHVVAQAVSSIIKQNIPELVGLNLTNNRLLSLSGMNDMTRDAPNVTSLNLASNNLTRVEELDKIKGWKLTELILDGNPLCDKFTSKTEYISAVRKRFPKVIKLDGNDLPPPITFGVDTNTTVPSSQGSYFLNNEVKDLVVRFLKEYYTLYDSENRQPLVDAYHDSALFSMSVAFCPVSDYGSKQPNLGDYFSDSRNSLRIRDERNKARTLDKLLRKGRLQVMSALGSLPKTTHDPNSFVVDVGLVSSTLLSFTVNGLFKESDNKADKPPIRAFSRCFVAVPAGGGVLIINDTLTITNATSDQQQAAFKNTGPTPSSSPVSSNPPTLSPAPTQVASSATSPAAAVASPVQQQLESLPPERQQMVLAFSQQSNMNYIFSFRCLEDNAWDFEKSAKVFLDLKTKGAIPPEAFEK